MSLPIFHTQIKEFSLHQTQWATELNPIINNAINGNILLKSVVLASGDNTINHTLGRKLQGWVIVRQRAAATFYDKQDANKMPELTLVLNASAAVTVDLLVF